MILTNVISLKTRFRFLNFFALWCTSIAQFAQATFGNQNGPAKTKENKPVPNVNRQCRGRHYFMHDHRQEKHAPNNEGIVNAIQTISWP